MSFLERSRLKSSWQLKDKANNFNQPIRKNLSAGTPHLLRCFEKFNRSLSVANKNIEKKDDDRN